MAEVCVVMSGDRPLAVADTADVARAEAERQVTRYRDVELRWDAHHTGWRLMSRSGGRGRFAWTTYWVADVPQVGGEGR